MSNSKNNEIFGDDVDWKGYALALEEERSRPTTRDMRKRVTRADHTFDRPARVLPDLVVTFSARRLPAGRELQPFPDGSLAPIRPEKVFVEAVYGRSDLSCSHGIPDADALRDVVNTWIRATREIGADSTGLEIL